MTVKPESTGHRGGPSTVSKEALALSQALHRARKDADREWTQAAMAKELDVGRNVIGRILSGHRPPSKTELKKLAEVLGADLAKLEGLRQQFIRAETLKTAPMEVVYASHSPGRDAEECSVQYYNETDEFYRALTLCLSSASRSIKTTYIRQLPPDRYNSQVAAEYFSALLKWSSQGGKVARVIGVPVSKGVPHEEFIQWLVCHAVEAQEYPNYDVHVVEWAGPFDAINMALIDDASTYLTFSKMHAQDMTGLSAEGSLFQAGFSAYWGQLWLGGLRLERYIASLK